MPSDITNATLAQNISDLIDLWRTRELQMVAWITGVAGGGDHSNGTYPLSDYLGNVTYQPSPAQLASGVVGPVANATAQSSAAAASATAASAAQVAAQTARDLALSYQTGAQAARDLALGYKNQAADSAANAGGSAGAAATSQSAAATSETNAAASATAASGSASAAVTSATNSASSASAAASSAAAAATFNPANFYTTTASDGRYAQLTGASFTGLLTTTLSSGNPLAALLRNSVASSYTSLRLYNDINSSSRALEIDYMGSAYPSLAAIGGPSGEQGAISTIGAYPLVLGTANTARLIIGGAGGATFTSTLAVNGSATISTGTGQPLELVTSSNGPWALVLTRSDLANSVKVYNSGGAWFFGNPIQATSLALSGAASFANNVWNTSNDGQPRLYFATGAITYFGTATTFEWRNSAQSAVATLSSAGTFSASGDIYAQGGFRWGADASFYLYNTSSYSYGSWRVGGSRGGYVGVVLDDGVRLPTFMSAGSASGIYNQNLGYWDYYNDGTYFRIGRTPYCDVGNAGAILHLTAGQGSGRVFVQNGGSPVGTTEGDITLIW